MEAQSLIAFDTNHIKGYVFATDTLKEIRGASSLLDRLNRKVMPDLAEASGGKKIYANGGSGLFLVASKKAETLGMAVQQEYRRMTAGGASVTYVVQSLPVDAPGTRDEIMQYPMPHTLALLRYRLRERKGHPCACNEASHPLMRPCSSCGIFYSVQVAPDEPEFCCDSCLSKRYEDREVKEYIPVWIRQKKEKEGFESPLWNEVLGRLQYYNYRPPETTERPEDFNVFSEFRHAKGYLGLIYADANGMGKKLDTFSTLQEIHDFAKKIDEAVHWAMCKVISDHLPLKELEKGWVFPFDILLIGGDDLVLVTSAAQAMAVASALAEQFYRLANGELPQDDNKQEYPQNTPKQAKRQDNEQEVEEKHSLSVGVVLAPTNYPFSLLLDLVEDTLKFAKKDGSKTFAEKESTYGKTRVNFLVVSGSTSQHFHTVYAQLHQKNKTSSFYATMRPYTLEQLQFLLAMLQEGGQHALGRTKLHQLREAILQLNLSTSVIDSLAVLRTWKEEERNFVVKEVYQSRGTYPLAQWDEQNPAASFPIVTFPWLVDKENNTKRYRTLLLDFAELYDFVAQEGGNKHVKD